MITFVHTSIRIMFWPEDADQAQEKKRDWEALGLHCVAEVMPAGAEHGYIDLVGTVTERAPLVFVDTKPVSLSRNLTGRDNDSDFIS